MQRTLNFILIITTSLFLLAMLSCSTMEEVKQGYAVSRQKRPEAPLSRVVVDQFFHQVQPVQKEIEKLYGLAVKLQKLHRHYPAIGTFKEILQQDPDNIEALNGVAVSSDLMGAHATAASYYQQALKVNPKLDHIWNNLGYCYFLQNQMDLSIDAYQKAIAINPDLLKYRNNLALVLAKQKQLSGSQDQIKLAQNKIPLPKVPAKTAPKKELENSVPKPVINELYSKIDIAAIEIVTQKKTVVERGKIARQIDTTDLEPVQLGVLKQLPIFQSSKEIAPKDLGLEQAPLLSDLLANLFVHKDQKNGDQERKTGNRPDTEKIPFKSLPPLNFIQNIAEIERPKISIKAREPVEVDTVLTSSKVTKPSPRYQVSLPKISSDRLVIIPPPVENQMGPLKHLRVNTRLKKKWAGKKIGLKRRTMVAKQTAGIQVFGLEVSNGNGIRHLARNVSTHLKNRGVQVSRITNATHFQYHRTKLYYLKGLLDKARKLAKIIPGRQDFVEVPAFDHDHVRIKLVLGKDISSANLML